MLYLYKSILTEKISVTTTRCVWPWRVNTNIRFKVFSNNNIGSLSENSILVCNINNMYI